MIDVDAVAAVTKFLQTHLLYWLEILNLINEINIASQALRLIQIWVRVSLLTAISTL